MNTPILPRPTITPAMISSVVSSNAISQNPGGFWMSVEPYRTDIVNAVTQAVAESKLDAFHIVTHIAHTRSDFQPTFIHVEAVNNLIIEPLEKMLQACTKNWIVYSYGNDVPFRPSAYVKVRGTNFTGKVTEVLTDCGYAWVETYEGLDSAKRRKYPYEELEFLNFPKSVTESRDESSDDYLKVLCRQGKCGNCYWCDFPDERDGIECDDVE